jgi:periplasmic protein TonB
MFDLVTGKAQHLPSHAALPILLSTTTQAAAVIATLVLSALFVTERIPVIPTRLVFVAPLPPASSSPPPVWSSPPTARRSAAAKPVAQRHPVASRIERVPVEAPKELEPEPTTPEPLGEGLQGRVEDGVPGGIEGGIPGGVVGGIEAGLPEPPPPAPPPATPRPPVRIAGRIRAPRLLHRVEPHYPPIAVAARLQGIVILEANVDLDGRVTEVKVLRSAGELLDGQARLAVRQWRYSPLVLNGRPERFVLTVILSFSVENKS